MRIKIIVTSFHKRIVNLTVLKLFYFLKKEFSITPNSIFFHKVGSSLFNVLKSPVQYKVGRNQLGIVPSQMTVFISIFNIGVKKKIKCKLYNLVSSKIILSILKNTSSSYYYKIIKIF